MLKLLGNVATGKVSRFGGILFRLSVNQVRAGYMCTLCSILTLIYMHIYIVSNHKWNSFPESKDLLRDTYYYSPGTSD